MFEIQEDFLKEEVLDGFIVLSMMKSAWAAELKTLDAIQTFCRKHDITCYAAFGTLLLNQQTLLREYCDWLFPILERTEELSVPKGKDRSDRNIGYMGETLETLYFIKNVDKLNVVHTECKLYT